MMEVAGGFGKTTVNYQKRKLEEEEKERIRRHKQWVKDMKMIEPPKGTKNPRYSTKGYRHSSKTRKGLEMGDLRHPPTKLYGG